MLGDVQPTPYDLRWRMFGIPVSIHPLFWVGTGILGFPILERSGFAFWAIWIACVLVSILAHEYGHALTGQRFGLRPHVVLYLRGGLAINSAGLTQRSRRLAVILAGPGTGLVFWAILAYGVGPQPFQDSPHLRAAYRYLCWINLFWSLMNLLPVIPLDGGQVSREIFTWALRRDGLRSALMVSVATAALVVLHNLLAGQIPAYDALLGWVPGGTYVALLFAMLGFENFMLLRQLRDQQTRWDDDRVPWER